MHVFSEAFGYLWQVEAPLAGGPAFIHTVTSEQLHLSSCWMSVPGLLFMEVINRLV